MLVSCLLLALGLVLIIKGGDWFVDASSWIAEVSGIPKLIVGATIVSFATTLPELLVSAIAAKGGSVEMAVGNAVGSVTANTGLIMALGLLFMPAVIERKDYIFKSVMLIGSSVLLYVLCLDGNLDVLPSLLLLIPFALYMADNVKRAAVGVKLEKTENRKSEKPATGKKDITVNIIKFIVGVAGIIIGAKLLVNEGTKIAEGLGVSERIIAVTIIAIGTSLPELVTTLTAIVKHQNELSVGNIIGANIIDITMILPVCSIVSGKPLTVGQAGFLTFDMPAMIIVGVIALVPALITKKFSRWQGVLLLAVYIGYMVVTVV